MKILILLLLTGGLLLTNSCKKQNVMTTSPTEKSVVNKANMCYTTYDLMAGQHYVAGMVIVTNDLLNIYVTYSTSNNWVLNQTHLYVGGHTGVPLNMGGNPKIGQFPYAQTHAGITSYTYTIPIVSGQNCYTIATHAVVSQNMNGVLKTSNETAWGSGSSFPGNSWAMYNSYSLCQHI